MPDIMKIISRDAFAQVLSEARRHVRQLDPASWSLLRQVATQLEFMAQATVNGRVPSGDELTSTTLAPLAARNLERALPDLADELEEIDYAFRRYPLLPEGPPVRRRGILQVWTGRDSFRKLTLELGVPRTVGTAGAEFVANGDPAGSPHFQIVWDGVSAHVQALPPHRLTINGEPAWYGELSNRGWMTAGATSFRLLVEDRTPPPAPVTPSAASLAALERLNIHCDGGGLHVIIDAARSERALQLVEESIDPYASLYDGEQGRAFDDIAPYLVHLHSNSWLLERLVTEGWGDAWGIYLESRAGFDAIRRHLRQFLMVDAADAGHRLFFRFYDPRVMPTFAPLMTPEQPADLLKGLSAIFFEDSMAGLSAVR